MSREAHYMDNLKTLRSKYGHFESAGVEDEEHSAAVVRMPSLSLNYSWNGGIYLERMHLLHGGRHSGKSTIMAQGIAAMQKLCRNCYQKARTVDLSPGADPAKIGVSINLDGAIWANQSKPTFQMVRNVKDPRLTGRVFNWHWRSKNAKNAIVWGEQWRDPSRPALGFRHEVFEVDLDSQKAEWIAAEDDGTVLSVRYCDCILRGNDMPRYMLGGKREDDRSFQERLAGLRKHGNSYDALTCDYYDTEDKADQKWLGFQGVDPTRVHFQTFASGEDYVDAITASIEGGTADIVVIDSLEYFEPDKIVESSQHDEFMGNGAKLVNGALRKWVIKKSHMRRQSGRCPTILLSNQERKDMKGNTVLPKGSGQLFATSTITKFWASDIRTEKETGEYVKTKDDDTRQELISINVNFNPSKVCSGPPHIQGSFTMAQKAVERKGKLLVNPGGVSDHRHTWNAARTYGLILSEPGSWSIPELDLEQRTEELLKDEVIESPDTFEALKEMTLQAMFKARDAAREGGM